MNTGKQFRLKRKIFQCYVFVDKMRGQAYGHVWVLRIASMEMLVSNAMLLDFLCARQYQPSV